MDDAARFTSDLLADLQGHADPERARNQKAYLKSDRAHIGVRVPVVRAAVRTRVRLDPPEGREALFDRAEALWATDVFEACLAACEMAADAHELFARGDLDRIEGWIRRARTWALVDVLAPRLVGSLLDRDPAVDDTLAAWSQNDDPWIRRSAVLAYLGPLHRGEDVFTAFARHAEVLLEDDSFWVRKALGWCLRERSKCRPDEVVAWLAPRASRASGLTVREATRRLPEEAKATFDAEAR